MTRRIFYIAVAALAGCIAALLTLPRSKTAPTVMQTEGDAGSAVVDTPEVRIANRKKTIAQMQQKVAEIDPGKWLTSWRLIERSGMEMGSEELKGQPYIASFFFSTCPVVCVRQNDQVKLLQEKFRKYPIRLVSITCDPENDSPDKLSAYAERVGADRDKWLFFTGDWNYLKRVSSEVFFNGLHSPKEHIEKFLLMDADGKLIAEYDWHDPQEIAILEADVKQMFEDR